MIGPAPAANARQGPKKRRNDQSAMPFHMFFGLCCEFVLL
jgi:hypothetical protein